MESVKDSRCLRSKIIEHPVPHMINAEISIPLEELTGEFISKHEKNLSILQQIFFKLSGDQPINVDFFHEIFGHLGELREKVWEVSLVNHDEAYLDHQLSFQGPNVITKLDVKIMKNVINFNNLMMKTITKVKL